MSSLPRGQDSEWKDKSAPYPNPSQYTIRESNFGNKYIFVFVDKFTKYLEAYATPDVKAESFAWALRDFMPTFNARKAFDRQRSSIRVASSRTAMRTLRHKEDQNDSIPSSMQRTKLEFKQDDHSTL